MTNQKDSAIWKISFPKPDTEAWARELNVPPLVVKLLANRGIATITEGAAFLKAPYDQLSDPTAILNMGAAVGRIAQAMHQNKKITVYGDYDVDGICATVLVRQAFRSLGYPVSWYIPSRFSEGYGMNALALQKLQEEGTDLIVTVDNGIASRALVEAFPNLDFVITDHHRLPDALPQTILVNPHLDPDPTLPFANLCGCGLAFMVMRQLFRTLRPREADQLERELLDLVAIATIADVVPLTGDNRILVRHGIEQIKRAKRPGLLALLEHIGLNQALLRSTDIAFQIAPRINACGRMDVVGDAINLLECADSEEAAELAEIVNGHNETRKDLEKEALTEALEQLDQEAVVDQCAVIVRSPEWHPGVIGIVASRLTERFNLPALVFTQDRQDPVLWSGSARSVPGLDLYAALETMQEELHAFGGHEMAAGLSVREGQFNAFRDKFICFCVTTQEEWLQPPIIQVDALIRPEEINRSYFEALEHLEPYGCGNPEPIFLWENAQLTAARRIGRNGDHLRLEARKGDHSTVSGVFFRASKKLRAHPNTVVDLLFSLTLNRFRGEEHVEMRLMDLRPSWMGDDPLLNGLLEVEKISPALVHFPCKSSLMLQHHAEHTTKSSGDRSRTLYIGDTPDVIWRKGMNHWDSGGQENVLWLSAWSKEEKIAKAFELFKGKSGLSLYMTRAFAEHYRAELASMGSFQQCDLPLEGLSRSAIERKPGSLQKRRTILEGLRKGSSALVYTRSLDEMWRQSRQLRAILPRSLRDLVAVLPPDMSCVERKEILDRLEGKKLLVLFVTDESPWSVHTKGIDKVLLSDPCYSASTYHYFQALESPEGVHVLFESSEWKKNAAYLKTLYPDRNWLGAFYTRLQQLSKTHPDFIPAHPVTLGRLLFKDATVQHKWTQVLAGIKIFREIDLLEVVVIEGTGYIKLIQPKEKRDLADSLLFSEGQDAKQALAQLHTDFLAKDY